MTIDPGMCVTIARPDIAKGWPEGKLNQCYGLETASGESLPILKEALVKLTLGQSPKSIWVFVTEITLAFILDLDVLHSWT
jgi:hypothetical protein